jgi:hypothetical protein
VRARFLDPYFGFRVFVQHAYLLPIVPTQVHTLHNINIIRCKLDVAYSRQGLLISPVQLSETPSPIQAVRWFAAGSVIIFADGNHRLGETRGVTLSVTQRERHMGHDHLSENFVCCICFNAENSRLTKKEGHTVHQAWQAGLLELRLLVHHRVN